MDPEIVARLITMMITSKNDGGTLTTLPNWDVSGTLSLQRSSSTIENITLLWDGTVFVKAIRAMVIDLISFKQKFKTEKSNNSISIIVIILSKLLQYIGDKMTNWKYIIRKK